MAFALLFSFFHYRRLIQKGDDLRVCLAYFAAVFCLFLVIPSVIIFLFSPEPLLFLKEAGLSLGNWRRGLLIAGVGSPLAVLSGFIGSRDAELGRFYPFAKTAAGGAEVAKHYAGAKAKQRAYVPAPRRELGLTMADGGKKIRPRKKTAK